MDLGELHVQRQIYSIGGVDNSVLINSPEEIMKCSMKWISYFGSLKKISDGGWEFQNEEMAEFMEKQEIELRCTAFGTVLGTTENVRKLWGC